MPLAGNCWTLHSGSMSFIQWLNVSNRLRLILGVWCECSRCTCWAEMSWEVTHSAWGSAHHPWLALLGWCCVPCPSLGGLVMTQRNFWQYQGAALFPGRCLFLHYTFLGFFYTLIQADPGGTGNRAASWRVKGPLSCTGHRSGSFPGGHDSVTGLNASWWQLLHGSFQLCRGRGERGMNTAHPYIKTCFPLRPSVCLFIWKNQNCSAYLETSGDLPTTACYTNTSNYDVPCSKMTSFSKWSLYLASHSSKVHLCPNTSLSVSQTSAAVVLSISPVLLVWKLEILQIYNNLSKVFIINGDNHIWTEQFIPVLTHWITPGINLNYYLLWKR